MMGKNRFRNLSKDVQWVSFSLDTDQDIALDKATETLSSDEHDRANRFKFNKHRERYIRGRGFLRLALAERLDMNAKSIVLNKNKFDKPFIGESFTDKNPIYFNLTHSSNLAVLAICDNQPIGIDVEFITRDIEVLELGRTVFTDKEMSYLENAEGSEAKNLFFKFWTAKEAYLKLLGTGMSLSPKKVELVMDVGEVVGCKSAGEARCELTYIDLPKAETVCCVALPGSEDSGSEVGDVGLDIS